MGGRLWAVVVRVIGPALIGRALIGRALIGWALIGPALIGLVLVGCGGSQQTETPALPIFP